MKKFCYLITAVLFAVAVCAAVLCVGLNIPAFYEATVPTIVYWTCPGAELKGFAVKTARFRFPDRIELGGVEVAFKQDGHSHHIVMDKVTNQGLVEYLGGSGRVAVDVMIRSYLSEQFSGQNVIFNTLLTRNNAGETVTRTTGIVGTLSTADYHLQGVHYQVNGGHPVYDIKIKEGKFYGGQFKADIQLKAAGRMPYSGTVVLQDIPTGELNEAFPDLEKDFQGVFSGDIYLVGDRNKLLTLEANLISQQDMLVRSTLVGWIIQYNQINDDLVWKYLKDEIRKNPMMNLYQMEVTAQNKGQDLIKIQIRAKSRKDPVVNLNYNYDLKTDGDLLSTLHRLDGLLKQGLLGVVHAQQ